MIYRLEWPAYKLQIGLVSILQVARNSLQTCGAHLRAQKTAQRKGNRSHATVTPTVSPFYGKVGATIIAPIPTEPSEVPSGQEKEQPVTEATKFSNISQVNALTVKTLVSYFQSKVACFKAGRLQLFYDKWENITSDVEVLHMISGQKLESSKQPYQLYVPRDKTKFDACACWDPDQTRTCEVEVQNLLHKGAIVSYEHEKQGEYISPTFTTLKKNGSSRMILSLRPRLHHTGMKLCRLKIITFSTIHTVPVELYLLQLLFISLLKFAR